MSYETYKILHLTGIIMIFMSLSALCVYLMSGGTKESFKQRKLLAISHGVGLLLSLVAGFGLLARIQVKMSEPWVLIKIFLWLYLGAAMTLLYKKPKMAKPFWVILIGVITVATSLVQFKPF